MSPDISERSFEKAIECGLRQHGPDACAGDTTTARETPPPYGDTPPGGYRKRLPEDYDRALCLLPRDVVDFVLATPTCIDPKTRIVRGKTGELPTESAKEYIRTRFGVAAKITDGPSEGGVSRS